MAELHSPDRARVAIDALFLSHSGSAEDTHHLRRQMLLSTVFFACAIDVSVPAVTAFGKNEVLSFKILITRWHRGSSESQGRPFWIQRRYREVSCPECARQTRIWRDLRARSPGMVAS